MAAHLIWGAPASVLVGDFLFARSFELMVEAGSMPALEILARASRVIAEYKRFCFLAMEAGHPVTPSEDVDQAWHLHLVHTWGYWEDFCPTCLGRPLHHGPTKGGRAEGEKHADWYEKTRASYQRLFGEAPPADIWPSTAERFDRDLAWRRVNWRENWVIPKAPVRGSLKFVAAGVALMAMLGCAGGQANPLDLTGPEFLALYAGLAVACLVWNFAARAILNSPGSPPSDPEVSDYEIAFMQNGRERVFQTATVKLIQRGNLRLDEIDGKITLREPLPADADPIERAVAESYAANTDPKRALEASPLSLTAMYEKLIEEGMLATPGRRMLIRWVTTTPFLLLFLFGLVKISVGIDRGKPVVFLIVFSVICLLVTLVVLASPPRLTGYGKRFLARLKSRHFALRADKAQYTPDYAGIGLPVALFGAGVLIGSSYDSLGKSLRPIAGSGDGYDASSSAGGGGDGGDGGGGGGGGGCGGCGGGGGD